MIILKIILAIIIIAACIGMIALIMELFSKSNSHKPYGPYERFIKRFLDAFLATGALIVLSPILFITAILVRAKLGSPVLFTQERPGKDEIIFKLYKFRSMTNARDENGNLLSDDVRLTKFGRLLRSTSMDGNVIIGTTTESLVKQGFREVSPIHFSTGRDLKSYYNSYTHFYDRMRLLA